MRIEIVEVHDRHVGSGHEARRTVISHLYDDQDRLGHQRPAAKRQSPLFADAKSRYRRHGKASADRNPPTMLAAVHVDGEDAAEWRLEQRQSARSRQITGLAYKIVGRFSRTRL